MTDTGAPDTSALDAARSEHNGEAKTITLAGEVFLLPAKLPPKFLVGIGRLQREDFGGYEDAMVAALGREQFDRYIELPDASMSDWEKIPGAYGLTQGEAPASGMPSSTTGTPSRPTSNGSTGSTWGQPSSLSSLP